ncbi:hypothetical protein HUW63_10895 [Myxococcus sp. AM001]|nr:hypothetical protein [Myxococcus sp. AM001]
MSRQSAGNMLYARKLAEWLLEQPAESRRAELLPRGLEGFLFDIWQRLLYQSEGVREGLRMVAVAREALPQSVLALIARWEDAETVGAQFLRAARPFLLEERQQETGYSEVAFRPFHESFRSFILARLGVEGVRRQHRRLAEQLCAWPVDEGGEGFRRRYALRHAVRHLLEAGEAKRAIALCTDIEYLEAKCRESGPLDIEADLRMTFTEAQGDAQPALRALHQAIQSESHWLKHHPEVLGLLVYNRLLSLGWMEQQVREVLVFPRESPALRLRHPVSLEGGELRTLAGHEGRVLACAVTEDGRRVVSASSDNTLKIWETETGRELATLRGHERWVRTCAVTKDGQLVVSASDDGTLKVWKVETGQLQASWSGHEGSRILSCVLTADEKRVVSASSDKTLKVWDVKTGRQLGCWQGHEGGVWACAVTRDGQRVVSASSDGTLKVWHAETGRELHTWKGHEGAIRACAILPDGCRLVSASSDGTLKLWELETGRELASWHGHESEVRTCAVTGNGQQLISASSDGTLKLWEVKTGQELTSWKGHDDGVWGCAATGDGTRVVSASEDKTLKVWDVKQGRELTSRTGHRGKVLACAVAPDGRSVMSISSDGMLKEWELETGRELTSRRVHEGEVLTCAVTGDGQRVAIAPYVGTLKIQEVKTGRELASYQGHDGWMRSCAVTADGQRVVSAFSDGTLTVWSVATGRPETSWRGQEAGVTACAVTGDGLRVASASADGTLTVWEAETGRPLATWRGHDSEVLACAVAPDGRRVVSASSDGTLKVWEVPSGRCLSTLYGNNAFLSLSLVGGILCAGDTRGNVWFMHANPEQPAMKNVSTTRESYDLGIVIALKEEFKQFHELLPSCYESSRDEETSQYDYLFEYPGTGHRCVVTLIGEMNPGPAGLQTERLIRRWNPRITTMLGIAAGIHPDVKVGDVVVASQIDDYLASAKAVPGQVQGTFEFSLGGTVYQGDHELITHVRNLEFAQRAKFTAWTQACAAFLKAQLGEAQGPLIQQQLIRSTPELMDVHLASGSIVGATQDFGRWLQTQRDRTIKVLEMESPGLMAAAIKRVEPKRTLVIRGISDYGDDRKTSLDNVGAGVLRRYAMHNATKLLWALVEADFLPRHAR